LRPGEYTLYGGAAPGEIRNEKLREKLMSHRDEIAVACTYVTLAGQRAEQRVVLQVPPIARLPED